MRKLLLLVALLLSFALMLASCNSPTPGGQQNQGNTEDIFQTKTPREIHSAAVSKYNRCKTDKTPYTVSIDFILDGEKYEVDLAYDGEAVSYKIVCATEHEIVSGKMTYLNGKLYYRDYGKLLDDGEWISTMSRKLVYDTEYRHAKKCIDDAALMPYVSYILPHDLPASWFENLQFWTDNDGARMLEIDIDEAKSNAHSEYSDFFVKGSTCKIYFAKNGDLTKIEVKDAYIAGENLDLVATFTWDVEGGITEPDDKDDYTYYGEFDYDKGHTPGNDYRDNDDIDDPVPTPPGGDDDGDNDDGTGGNTGGGSDEPKGDYYWGNSAIKIALYENDNGGELSSGLKRFYAGADDTKVSQLDTDIRVRNAKATEVTGVSATYSYETDYGWGGSLQKIPGETSVTSDAYPDVYCNFVYDMTSLAIRGCFINLYANTDKSSEKFGEGYNYFAFTKDGYQGIGDSYFDSSAGGGYLFEYMQSLVLKNANGEYDKMYCIASDYTLDVIRAIAVMPVNVNMMNIDLETWSNGTYVKDQDGDGDHDIDDFYKLVWEGKWTYDVLAEYSNAVFSSTNSNADSDPNVSDIGDVLGVAFGQTNGLTSSALLYSSGVSIINYENGTYIYPASNAELDAFAAALNGLFENNANKGICSVNKGVFNSSSDLGDIAGIRERFSEGNTMLFGGVALIGSLEESAYQNMTVDGKAGFGVVCVPMYKNGSMEDYRTYVHNVARVATISANTTEFEQCTAFLNYQSTNSAKILDAYYNQVLMGLVNSGDAKANNVKMLTFIRNHVRDCFDKTFEDVVSAYMKSNGNANADAQRWHQYFRDQNYKVSNIPYSILLGTADQRGSKTYNFNTILNEWKNLK